MDGDDVTFIPHTLTPKPGSITVPALQTAEVLRYDPTSGSVTGATVSYLKELVSRLWNYKAEAFGPDSPYFEENSPRPQKMRPPVFTKEAAERNVLVAPDMTEAQRR